MFVKVLGAKFLGKMGSDYMNREAENINFTAVR